MIEINVKQPSIVLIDQGTAEGSLTIPPRDFDDKQEAKFWKARSIIYRMSRTIHGNLSQIYVNFPRFGRSFLSTCNWYRTQSMIRPIIYPCVKIDD